MKKAVIEITNTMAGYKKLYFGTTSDVVEYITSNGITADILTDNLDAAKAVAKQLPGAIYKGIAVFEILAAADEIGEPFPIVRASGDEEGNYYAMLKDIKDLTRIKMICRSDGTQSLTTNDVIESSVPKSTSKTKSKKKDKVQDFEQLTFWS